jgi:hypothetical protein
MKYYKIRRFIGQQGNLIFCCYEYENHIRERELDKWIKLGWEIVEVRYWLFSDFRDWRRTVTLENKLKIIGLIMVFIGLIKTLIP